jgi:alanine dehydrogenase
MRIGVLKEIKDHECRVGLTPDSVRALIAHQQTVLVEQGAGVEAGFSNEAYQAAGARIVLSAAEIFLESDLIIKVKEPQSVEYQQLRSGQILMAFLHLAPDLKQARGLLSAKCTAFAYETLMDEKGRLPLLAPMSEIAGRLSIQAAAHFLLKDQGGSGVLLSQVSGVHPAKVVVLGGGVAGTAAIRSAVSLGANVVVLDTAVSQLQALKVTFQDQLTTTLSSGTAIAEALKGADVLVGAVLIPGAAAPKIVPRALLAHLNKGSVVVDLAIDQGGCFESSRPTTYSAPIYREEGILHYCVTNMPAGVPKTASIALNKATLPFILELVDKGAKRAVLENPLLQSSLNIHNGHITHLKVAEALKLPFLGADRVFSSC